MNFKQYLLELLKEKKGILFVDMDGVIAEYVVGLIDYKNARPLKENIEKLKEIATIPTIELCILSICKKNDEIIEKEQWLDLNAPFFSQRKIISKEQYPDLSSKELKLKVLRKFSESNEEEKEIIVLDDDNQILKYLYQNGSYHLFQDSSLID